MNSMRSKQEIHEAINAADDALNALHRARSSLANAGGWGLWDMFGGGFFSTMMKQGKMDQARRELDEAREAMNRFRNELADVGQTMNIDIGMGDFLRFADYFFDGFLADWMVQSKIRQAQQKIDEAIRRVEQIRGRLWSMIG